MTKIKWRYCSFLLLLAGFSCFAPLSVSAQSNIEVFGQNRIQTKENKFDWKYFDTRHFRVYHYDKAGRQLGRYVAEESEYDMAIIEKKLGGQFPQRFNIILYNNYDEYRQTNVGLKDESPTLGNTKAGAIKIVDDKLVVYFTGEHADLRRQIRSGMALVVMQRMIYGESFKKMVKNSLILNLPQWVTDGYIAYLVDGWDQKSNSEWKGILDAYPKRGFYQLAEQYPELAGKAFWKFVSNQYGANTVKNLLYSMQQKTSLNKAMMEPANLNMKVTKAYDSCIKYYRGVYTLDARQQEKPDSTNGIIALKVPKDNSILRNIKVSPSGEDVSYVAWKDGRYKVFTQKTVGSKTRTTLLEGGQKDLTDEVDPNYPMLAWSKTGNKLAMLYKNKKGDKTLLRIYNNKRGRIENYNIKKNRFDRVLSMTFMEDDAFMVFSAIKKSQTDLYMFSFKGTKMTNITDDPWDDLSPEFVSGGARTGILFLSNRPKPNLNVPVGVNELPAGPVNVFFYNTKSQLPELLQCSDVHKGRITQPIQYGAENFAYLHDSNGINNKFVVLFGRNSKKGDSAYSVPITNYTTSILNHQYNPATGDVADVVQVKDKYMVFFHDLQMPNADSPAKVLLPTILSIEKPEPIVTSTLPNKRTAEPENDVAGNNEEEPTKPEIKGGNAFQTEFDDNEEQPKKRTKTRHTDAVTDDEMDNGITTADSSLLTEITDSAYLKMKPSRYRSSFKPDFLSIKLDNSILFNQYQSIASNGGNFTNPTLGPLTNISLNELMENHRFTVGFQLPLSARSRSSNYFVQYQNFKKRTDWGVLFLRKQTKQYNEVYITPTQTKSEIFKSTTNMVQSDFSYPFDRLRSIRFHTALRDDDVLLKVTDTFTLTHEIPDPHTYTSFSKLEYVFDNTISLGTNLQVGTRYKVYAEYIYGLNKGNKGCYNFGLDYRRYNKIYKNIILANRFAYAHSDGTSVVEYMLGGVDNWIAPDPMNSSQPPDGSYGFQMLATSMRGYYQYEWKGNNYAVLTTELRVPVVTAFVKRPVQSAILKNLQMVAFVDAGSAWRGFVPTAENMAPRYTYPQPGGGIQGGLNNVYLNLTVPKTFGLGYGTGLRSSLFGYFVRLDAAWHVKGSVKPLVCLALGTDF